MNAERLVRIPIRMKEFVDGGTAAGIVTAVMRHGSWRAWMRWVTRTREQNPMRAGHDLPDYVADQADDKRGDHAAGGRGAQSPNDPVEKYLPEFKGQKLNPCGSRVGTTASRRLHPGPSI